MTRTTAIPLVVHQKLPRRGEDLYVPFPAGTVVTVEFAAGEWLGCRFPNGVFALLKKGDVQSASPGEAVPGDTPDRA